MAALSSTSTLKDITPAYNPNCGDSKRETKLEENPQPTLVVESLDDTDKIDPMFTLVSKDGVKFELPKSTLVISALIRTAIEKDSTATELPVDVNASTLVEIVGYMKYKKGVEGPYPDKPLKTKIWKEVCKDTQDADMFTRLMEKDKQNIYDLMLAANYLDIPVLMHYGAAMVATWIKGKPLEELPAALQTNAERERQKQAATSSAPNAGSNPTDETPDALKAAGDGTTDPTGTTGTPGNIISASAIEPMSDA